MIYKNYISSIGFKINLSIFAKMLAASPVFLLFENPTIKQGIY